MTQVCVNCSNEISSDQRSDSRYCSDDCRNTYWNNVKRVIARKEKAINAINDIKALLNESSEAIWALRSIKDELKDISWE